jgi:hypothetical protein
VHLYWSAVNVAYLAASLGFSQGRGSTEGNTSRFSKSRNNYKYERGRGEKEAKARRRPTREKTAEVVKAKRRKAGKESTKGDGVVKQGKGEGIRRAGLGQVGDLVLREVAEDVLA